MNFFFIFLHLSFVLALRIPRVVVIGGGAAGYFGAIECAKTLRSHFKKSQFEVHQIFLSCLSAALLEGFFRLFCLRLGGTHSRR